MTEYSHREKKRKIEMALIVGYLKEHFNKNNNNVLEFGCGDGFQVPYLEFLSKNVTAIDLEIDKNINKIDFNAKILQSSINYTPFDDNRFSLIFSNHVIEHLDDLYGAVDEMARIGTDDCIYAFSVPTSIWLILSLPAQYYRKIKYFFSLISNIISNGLNSNKVINSAIESSPTLLKSLAPKGHGVHDSFFDCYNSFKIKSWASLFKRLGFDVLAIEPLLLYSASEFPVIPTTRILTKFGVCSSVLFILKKNS